VSIRVLFGTLLALVMLLAGGLFFVTILQRDTATTRTAAEHQRVTSFLLSDQMRQSSNDLTRMVRLYVTTGDPRYRRYYDEILAIRRGAARRPVDYDSSFWDRVLADPTAPIRTGPPASLPALMRQAGFSGGEFTALDASLQASDYLAQLEERVMNHVAGRIARGVDRSYLGDVEPDYQRLVDTAYDRQKGRIMAAIGRFTSLVDSRASTREAALQSRTQNLLVSQTVILALLGLTLLVTLAVAARMIGRPLGRLTSVTRRIAGGDWSERAPAAGVAELRELAQDFNEMADAVENDLIRRRSLEAELHRARETAEDADRAKSAFVAMMSHELRTPLVAVTGTLEVLALGELDDDQRALVDVATRSARALLGVIGDVLDFSKIEAGHLDLTPAPTSVAGLVDDVLAQHRLAAPGSPVALRSRIDPALAARHLVDPVRLRQVLGNLVGNAAKFTREGHVEVRVDVSGAVDGGAAQDIAIVVEDTGIGVSPADQERLFAPFEQASGPGSESGSGGAGPGGVGSGPGSGGSVAPGGTGLGLVICRQLVEAMGGTVGLESELGRGTSLRIDLTLAVAVGPPDGAHGGGDDGGGGGGGPPGSLARRPLPSRAAAEREGSLVLLVEDHPINREILARQLEAVGFVTDTAADAGEALDRFARDGPYGLVFTDIQLPGADGRELARRLRAFEAETARARTPIIALTANALRGERERCAEAGMDDLVVKPATLATLARTLREWLPGCAWPPDASATPAVGAGAGAAGARGGGGAPDAARAAEANDAATAAEPEIDLSALEELTGGDPELGRDIVNRYVESLNDELDAVWRALRAGDAQAMRRHAHRIAGASRTVGAHAVAAEAARLERAADGDEDRAELERLAEALRTTASG
jgi:signal transduction histidine kinase/CheY-like chemotaxis protein/HPt (histidine-containing phosphotransfer) domain-containing protein